MGLWGGNGYGVTWILSVRRSRQIGESSVSFRLDSSLCCMTGDGTVFALAELISAAVELTTLVHEVFALGQLVGSRIQLQLLHILEIRLITVS